MTSSASPDPTALSSAAGSNPLRWSGHMADDVAATFGSTPGATLTATPDSLHLKGNRGDFLVPRTAIVRISRGGFYPWFFKGIRIRHRVTGAPRNLQFLDLAGSTRELLGNLASLGYPVR